MATTWTPSNRLKVVVDVHPPTIFRALGPNAGKASGGGAWRGVRCTLTASGTYATGGDNPPSASALGLQRVEAIVQLSDAVPATNGQHLRFNSATGKIMLYTSANVEVTAATATTGVYDVIILGR